MAESILHWLALLKLTGIRHTNKLKLLNQYSPLQLFQLQKNDLIALGLSAHQAAGFNQKLIEDSQSLLAQCRALNIHCIDLHHPGYPSLLREISDPPLLLFVKGDPACLQQDQLAIVGPRMATFSAVDIAEEFSYGLSERGLTITSGLALGIDSAAHRGALNQSGKTIAVVATGLDQVYPRHNHDLAERILTSGGAIVSEYVPGTPPRAGHFPRRNRIITGMSLGTLVVEAALKSGSLISARLAMEQNREVFAIPGSIYNANAKGCHQLIKQGAHLVECVQDVSSELVRLTANLQAPKKPKKIKKIESQGLFLDPLLASVDYEATPADVVASRCKLPVEEVLTRLTILELRGLVVAVPGGFLKQK
ncbi:DNA-protecting protein DprA [Thalassotalea litorea]|uniref:DNA-protecting protein DprA n=1 Tax=Thalassotalea litorea TaxID=2020715 RepID=A0A5R9IIL3_9GAMM|nr:DNA-processing protein DprA [Thalassotalea litorea]TLU65384.1 DNA-protecting protein DprA [Thalassotalea litorea]